MAKREVYRKSWWHHLAIFPVLMFLLLWNRTLRIEISEEHRKRFQEVSHPCLFIFWHNRLFGMGAINNRLRKKYPLATLVSASRDGAWFEAVLKQYGCRVIRGSSNYRGAQSLKELIRAIREGYDIAITPDGSRGPVYEAKPGFMMLAKRCNCPVFLMSFDALSCWRLKSWDRFIIPKPFSKLVVRAQIILPDQLPESETKESVSQISAQLKDLQQQH